MLKNLTQSAIDRQNILVNTEAIELIQKKLGLNGLLYENEYVFTTKMVMDYYEISRATVSRYVNTHQEELLHNGYQVLKGQKLKLFKESFAYLIVPSEDAQSIINDTLLNQSIEKQNVSDIKKIKALAIFNFRACKNLSALLFLSF